MSENGMRPGLIFLLLLFLAAACGEGGPAARPPPADDPVAAPDVLIPLPFSDTPTGRLFPLTEATDVYFSPDMPELRAVATYLVERLRPATGYPIDPIPWAGASPPAGSILLTLHDADPSLGGEGYTLNVTPERVSLSATLPEGVFRGVQTLRQLLPPEVEASTAQPGPWEIVTRRIRDFPRFAWRGAMLDVARHFFTVEEVKRVIDLLACYKINRLHLHLTDDQGWRLMIHSWPNLAIHGGSTSVGGDPGGYYSQEDYAELVAYADSRYMMLIPEIDMPGHTHAALASYAELNADGVAPPLYTGTAVGFSSLAVEQEITYGFVDDVVREVAALTSGPYLHIGGDEAFTLGGAAYRAFQARVDAILQSYGKRMIGWDEIAETDLSSTSTVQYWFHPDNARTAAQKGLHLILSPAAKTFLSLKYHWWTPLGRLGAGFLTVEDAYAWDPATEADGVEEQQILGVEAPLWTETIRTLEDIEFMVFPRIAGHAEIGWSQAADRDWEGYRIRLGAHGPRWDAMNVNFYRSTSVPWGVVETLPAGF